MTVPLARFSLAALALPIEDPHERARLIDEWMTAYPDSTPIERGYLEQAATALIEKRRLARIRATSSRIIRP
jgi:hypothetical protein